MGSRETVLRSVPECLEITGSEEVIMKYVVVLGDGMADWPMESLNGGTPFPAPLPHVWMSWRECPKSELFPPYLKEWRREVIRQISL